MLAHPLVHIGASDGGAHITSFSTYGDTGYLFSQFVRGSHHLTLEQAVKKITAEPAEIWGLEGRGNLAVGKAADVVVFDAARIDRGAEHAVFDMPGRGMRYVRDSIGVDTVVVNGAVAYRDGEYTSARTGTICT
jgi:N-acyl-D-aspartate/D-glutamate deacylase